MRFLTLILAAYGTSAGAYAQAGSPVPECRHSQTQFELLVHASYAETAPLFGPQGERAWAGKHWNPEFIYPAVEKDIEGAVFTIQHGELKATWVNTLFDLDGRHFQYVYFLPDLMVTVIDVRFKPLTADSTAVSVVYTRTAITPEGNPHVDAMSEGDRMAGADWQKAIDAYLAGRKAGTVP
jgi:hypothetical protein